LTSLEKLVLKLKQKKQETSKLRSKAEKQLKESTVFPKLQTLVLE